MTSKHQPNPNLNAEPLPDLVQRMTSRYMATGLFAGGDLFRVLGDPRARESGSTVAPDTESDPSKQQVLRSAIAHRRISGA